MELRQLRYFVEVAEREHVTTAAESLHVAQSAVSFQISKLEEELGVKLFERVGRNVKLTPIGEEFLIQAKKALEILDIARKKIEEYLDPQHGQIRIGYMTSLTNHFLPNIIIRFRYQYPDISFQLHHASYHDLLQGVKNGDLNLAFVSPVPVKEHRIDSHILFSEPFFLLVPESHPLAERKEVALYELRDEPFVIFSKEHPFSEVIKTCCNQAGFSPKIIAEGMDTEAIKGLVSAKIGISLLQEDCLYESIPRFTKKIQISYPHVTRTVGIIRHKERELTPSEANFFSFVKELYSQMHGFW